MLVTYTIVYTIISHAAEQYGFKTTRTHTSTEQAFICAAADTSNKLLPL